jgi:hypothetical protein
MGGACRRWGHLVVLALVLPLALSSALPIFARVLGGPPVHLCHCAMSGGRTACGCPTCTHDRELRVREVALHGPCGDDEQAFGGAIGFALPPPPAVKVFPPDRADRASAPASLSIPVVSRTPPKPPPRVALS